MTQLMENVRNIKLSVKEVNKMLEGKDNKARAHTHALGVYKMVLRWISESESEPYNEMAKEALKIKEIDFYEHSNPPT